MPRGIKTCPACGNSCGAPSRTCECGHEFKKAAPAVPQMPTARQAVPQPEPEVLLPEPQDDVVQQEPQRQYTGPVIAFAGKPPDFTGDVEAWLRKAYEQRPDGTTLAYLNWFYHAAGYQPQHIATLKELLRPRSAS